jgi:membrane protein
VLSFGMILAIGFLLLVSLVISAGLSALGSWWGDMFGGWEILLQIVNFVVSVAVVTALFALIYKFLPRAQIGWHDVWIGAGATALLFTLGKFLIGLYIGKSSVASGFGAAGSLVVVLVWVYYSAQIFLLGAEFTWVYAFRHGSRRGEVRSASGHGVVPGKRDAASIDDQATPGDSVLTPSATLKKPSLQAQVLSAGIVIAAAAASEWVLEQVARRVERPRPLRRPSRWHRLFPFLSGPARRS